MGTICTSEPLRASTGVSPGFALPPPRSPGFWSHGRDSGPYSDPAPHRLYGGCGPVGFPTPSRLNLLGSPRPCTPRPVFQDGRCDPGWDPSYSPVARVSFGALIP